MLSCGIQMHSSLKEYASEVCPLDHRVVTLHYASHHIIPHHITSHYTTSHDNLPHHIMLRFFTRCLHRAMLKYNGLRYITTCFMQLRLQGNAEARGGDLKAAERVFSQALDLDIPQGKHLLHANRAGVRLTLGNAEGALQDAKAAVKLAPPNFTTAYIRQVRPFLWSCLTTSVLVCPALPCLPCSALLSTSVYIGCAQS